MKLKTITIQNFQSFGAVPTIIDLDRPGTTTLILGKNLDNTSSGDGANGTGKTSTLNAIVYGLYDKPLPSSDMSLDELVNNINKKQMRVVITFDQHSDNYTVDRCRKMKAGAEGNNVHFYKNGQDITLDSVANTNREIERIIGIPFDLFVRIVAFSAENISFFKLPVRATSGPNQTDIIEELFNLKTLTEKAELLKERIKESAAILKTLMMQAEIADSELLRHQNLIEAAQKRVVKWEQTHNDTIIDLKNRIDSIDQSTFQDISAIDIAENRDQYKKIDDRISKFLVLQQNYKNQHSNAKKLHDQALEHLEHLKDATCPYCLQDFKDNEQKKVECAKIRDDNQSTMVKLADDQKDLADAIKEQRKALANIYKVISNYDSHIEAMNQHALLQSRLTELQSEVNPHIENMLELESIKIEKPNMTKINDLQLYLDHQQFLLKLLTKKDSFVRKALLNKNIPFLNKRMQIYLNDLGLPHTVEFTHEMTANISQFGRTLSFGCLSNGQRSRVNLALSFAFRDVLQSMHDHINVCMLDEVLDVGLDAVGVQAAARMIKRKARDEQLSLFVISHRDEIDNAFDKKLIVQMSSGFSEIVE